MSQASFGFSSINQISLKNGLYIKLINHIKGNKIKSII